MPAVLIVIRPFSAPSRWTAMPTAELVRSMIASTPSWSNQRRAIAEPMSGLFWWSADRSSILRSGWRRFASSTASSAATTAPGPTASAKKPLMSVRMPILTVVWAASAAVPQIQHRATATKPRRIVLVIARPPSFACSAQSAGVPTRPPSAFPSRARRSRRPSRPHVPTGARTRATCGPASNRCRCPSRPTP